ncbi:MAG: AbrB/MazE/SpoVT family DNA-binding domain-containing protein [Candidatus Omnitrophica bacterium]|nr:AbrB/MazE/SpoVT family DNA-binding domain-containing protein [Candidatus Omnitrophota bacterium]
MATVLKMNRNRQINLPSAFLTRLSLGEDRYFKAEVAGNRIVLTPIDPVERVFSEEDLNTIEETYQREKRLAKPVTSEWIKKSRRSS